MATDPAAPGPETVGQILAASAARVPAGAALVDPAGPGIDFAGLLRATTAFRARLRALGIGPQDRVAVVLPNGAEPSLLLLGLLSSAVAAPLHPNLTPEELGAVLPRLRPAALLDLGGHPAAVAAAEVAGIPVRGVAVGLGPEPAIRLAGGPVGPPAPDRPTTADDLTVIISTSGTTGRAKLVPRRHRDLALSAVFHARLLRLTPSDRTAVAVPISHILGQYVLLRALVGGHPILCPARVDPGDAPGLADLVARHDLTWLQTTPALLSDLLTVAEQHPDLPNPSLRLLRCGSAELTPALRERAEAVFRVPLYNALGSSEATNLSAESDDHPHRPGTLGRALPGMRIADGDTPLPDGEAGEIQSRGPHVFPGYWDDPGLNARSFTPDGWFRTGDRGRIRDGYLELLGRADDTINRGGHKVDPREVSALLAVHPAVAEAAVFAVPDPRLGQEVAAAVVLRPDAAADARQLRRWLLDRLSPHKVPRKLLLLDALPRTATGKVSRPELRRLAADQRA